MAMDPATPFIIVRVEADERVVGLYEIEGGAMTPLQRMERLIQLDMPPVAFNTDLLIAVLRTPAPWTPSTTRAYEPPVSSSSSATSSPEREMDPVSPASEESSSLNETSYDEISSPPASPSPPISDDLTMGESEEEEEKPSTTN